MICGEKSAVRCGLYLEVNLKLFLRFSVDCLFLSFPPGLSGEGSVLAGAVKRYVEGLSVWFLSFREGRTIKNCFFDKANPVQEVTDNVV